MRKIVLVFFILIVALQLNAQFVGGRNIRIKFTPLKNTKVYLGGYYGSTMALFDSAMLNDKSEGEFVAPNRLTGGIYFLVTNINGYQIFDIKGLPFEILMDDIQQFSITADTTARETASIAGSAENDLNTVYSKFNVSKRKYLEQLKEDYKAAKTKKDSTRINDDYIKTQKEVIRFQDSIIAKNPNSLLATFLNTVKRPEVPAIPVVKGKPDSLYPYHFVKAHYWDEVNFGDDRILHTPFFEPKVDEYFKTMVSIEADSVINEVNYLLLSAKGSKEMYPYLLNKFTKQYMNPQYMGQDKVFVYLFENFYLKGDTALLDASNKKIISDRAYNLMANLIGAQASPINLPDTAGKIAPLYGLKNDFTVLVFWDPACGHCKVELPRLDSIYRAKWKAMNIGIYAVNINLEETASWKKFIAENKLSGWVHTHETNATRNAEVKNNQMNFRQAYDIYKTPTLYLLDKDKRIIAKQLSMEQFDELIKFKLKPKL